MKNKAYNIIVFGDDNAGHKQFTISKKAVLLLATLFVSGICAAVAMVGVLVKNVANQTELVSIKKENESLKLANDRYLEASIEMERKLNLFDEKTVKLAQFVGVEPSGFEADGVGGPELFEEELNRYLRYDLGLLEHKAKLLEERFDTLDEAFQAQTDLLDSTPSLMPARGWISSGFKYRRDPFTQKRTWHNGVDISAHEGTPVYAPARGVVSYRGYQGGFGNLLVVNHGNGIETKYGHLSRFNVSKGQRVKRGDLIGYIGSTGRSTAPHLHYEIIKDEKAINPMKYIIRDVSQF